MSFADWRPGRDRYSFRPLSGSLALYVACQSKLVVPGTSLLGLPGGEKKSTGQQLHETLPNTVEEAG
jgi:hypothetical protein